MANTDYGKWVTTVLTITFGLIVSVRFWATRKQKVSIVDLVFTLIGILILSVPITALLLVETKIQIIVVTIALAIGFVSFAIYWEHREGS